MSVLSDMAILEKLYTKQISIEPFQFESLQPSSLDLTLGNDFYMPKPNAVVPLPYDREDIKTWFDSITVYDKFELEPGQFVIAQVQEKIVLPNNLMGNIQNRNSLIRLGVDVGLSSYINPGYSGRLPIAIRNLGTFSVTLVPGIRVCQLVLFETKTSTRGYGHQSDAKYQNEEAITLSRLPEDEEIAEYARKHGMKKKGLAEHLHQRIAEGAQHTLDNLTPEQKKLLGIK